MPRPDDPAPRPRQSTARRAVLSVLVTVAGLIVLAAVAWVALEFKSASDRHQRGMERGDQLEKENRQLRERRLRDDR